MDLTTPVDLFKEKKYYEMKNRIVGQAIEHACDYQKWSGYEYKHSFVQLVTPATQNYDAIKESKSQADLTDFDELLNQDLFMALAASSPAEQPEFKMNYSALL